MLSWYQSYPWALGDGYVSDPSWQEAHDLGVRILEAVHRRKSDVAFFGFMTFSHAYRGFVDVQTRCGAPLCGVP